MHKLIELKTGNASLGLLPELGGSIAWYRWCSAEMKQDWFRTADCTKSADAGAMACFPLFPYSNRIRNGQFSFNGRQVQLPVTEADPHFEHGHGWRQAWTVEYHDQTSAVLRYCHAPDSWPWAYEACQNIALYEDRLEIMLRITNCSAEPMPAGMGLHPFFPVTDGVYIEAALTSIWQVDDAILPVGLVDLPAQVHKIEVAKTPLDNVFGGWSRSARIVWPQQGASLEITAQEPLNFLVLYTPQGEPYFCAEPVSNATDAFNLAADGSAETGMMLLAAGETQSAVIRFVPSLNAASDRH